MLKINSNTCNFAFFDVDDTIINAKSMFTFMDMFFKKKLLTIESIEFFDRMDQMFSKNEKWEIINSTYYSYFNNLLVDDVESTCLDWFTKNIKKQSFYHQNILNTLKKHQAEGVECVFVSGSFRELLQPIADDLGVEHILAINLECVGDRYTGKIIPPQTIGSGKAEAMRLFMEDKSSQLAECYAYGDDISDVPMLEIVGYPNAVTGGRGLEPYAREHGWNIIHPN